MRGLGGHIAGGIAAALAAAIMPGAALAVPMVGNAQTVVRNVSGVLDQDERTIYVDSDVFQDEDIVTGPKSATRIVFKDGTNLEMGENSRLKLTKLVFDPDPAKSKVAVKALVGVFRWTSGNLPHEAYGISTPVATIGVRGTTIELIVTPSGISTVALSRGAVVVANSRGESVALKPGEATTILPPDSDGTQQPPSAPGPLAANLQQMLWNMTVAILAADPPSDVNPSAGGGATAPVSFNTGGPGNGGPNTGTTGNSGPGNGPVTFSSFNPNQTSAGVPFVSIVPHQSGSTNPTNPGNDPSNNPGNNPSNNPGNNPSNNPGNNPSNNPGNNPSNNPGNNPSNNPGSNPSNNPGNNPSSNPGNNPSSNPGGGPTSSPKHVSIGTVTVPATPAGSHRSVSFVLVLPDGITVDLADLVLLDDPLQAFTVEFVPGQTPTATTDANGNPAEAFSLIAIFAPPEGADGPFTATLELPDSAGDLFDLTLIGDVTTIAEPAGLGLCTVGLAFLVRAGRRRAVRI